MKSYIEQILQPGERRIYSGQLHWVDYLTGLVWLIAALILFLLAAAQDFGATWLGLFLMFACAASFVSGVIFLFWAWFNWWTTEIEVTDRRVIYKEGFIRRTTVEMHMDKVESVDVKQTILGRMLDYGNVTIRGAGEGMQPLHKIAAPLELRNHITGVELAPKP